MPIDNVGLTSADMHKIRADLYRIYEDSKTNETLRQGVAVMINYYGAVLDTRMQATAEPRV